MEKLFELTFQDQTLNPQVGTFTDTSQTTGTFTLEDGEYYLTNGDTKGFYAYSPVAMQSGLVDDSKVIIEFDLKVVTASANTHAIIGTYAGVDGNGIPTGDKITLQYNAGDIELVLGSGTTATLIESADVVVDQWYHFRIDCALDALTGSTYKVKIDGVLITTVTGATADYELGIIGVLGTDLHACDECGIKNITLVTETNLYVGRTALEQALQDVKGYVDTHCMDLTSTQTAAGDKTFSGTTTTHDVIPATTDAYDLGGLSYQWNNAYIKSLTINGVACGDILTHNESEFVPRSGGAVISGTSLGRTDNTSGITFCGGTDANNGSHIIIRGKNSANGNIDIIANNGTKLCKLTITSSGDMNISNCTVFYPASDNATYLGYANSRWKVVYAATGTINTSDSRLKNSIKDIDDKLLNAWENIEPKQYKFNDATESKGEQARFHTGYIAQDIEKACNDNNIDAARYGLFCYDSWEEEPEITEDVEVEKDGVKTTEKRIVQQKREKGDMYALRYEEALVVECMYLRRCIARLTARIEELEKGNNTK